MNKKLINSFIALLCVVLAFSCGRSKKDKEVSGEDIIPVKLLTLQHGGGGSAVPVSGMFTTDDETVLSFKNGGVITRILVKEGDAIQKGQLLATLNPTEIEAGTQQATLAMEKAERDYQRASRLYKDSVATLEQMQNARTALDVARQQLKSASFNRSFTEIKATAGGFVLQRFASEGQIVGPGTPVLQINGAGKGIWYLKGGISDRGWASVSIGDQASVYSDALPGKVLRAEVFKKSESVDPASGTFLVYLKIKDKGTDLASGMFGKAEIHSSRTSVNSWIIPYDALLDGDAGKGYVFITNDRKTARKTEVSVGEIGKDQVVITGGLEDAKFLIISGSPYLNDGSSIKLQ